MDWWTFKLRFIKGIVFLKTEGKSKKYMAKA